MAIRFNRAVLWTVVPIGVAYAAVTFFIAPSTHSGKMQLNLLIALLPLAFLFAFLVGLATYLPRVAAGSDRRSALGAWVAQLTLGVLASIVIMVACGIAAVLTG